MFPLINHSSNVRLADHPARVDWSRCIDAIVWLVCLAAHDQRLLLQDAKPSESLIQTATVLKVIDGDTLFLSSGEKVRLIGIDCWENEYSADQQDGRK